MRRNIGHGNLVPHETMGQSVTPLDQATRETPPKPVLVSFAFLPSTQAVANNGSPGYVTRTKGLWHRVLEMENRLSPEKISPLASNLKWVSRGGLLTSPQLKRFAVQGRKMTEESTPGRIRTYNPRFRRPMRYPVAPRARAMEKFRVRARFVQHPMQNTFQDSLFTFGIPGVRSE